MVFGCFLGMPSYSPELGLPRILALPMTPFLSSFSLHHKVFGPLPQVPPSSTYCLFGFLLSRIPRSAHFVSGRFSEGTLFRVGLVWLTLLRMISDRWIHSDPGHSWFSASGSLRWQVLSDLLDAFSLSTT